MDERLGPTEILPGKNTHTPARSIELNDHCRMKLMLLRQGNRQKTALKETALNETALKEDSAGFVLLSFVVYVFVVVDRSESFGLGGCRALGQALPSVRGGAPPDSFLLWTPHP